MWWILILVIGGSTVVVPGRFETQVKCFDASRYAESRLVNIEGLRYSGLDGLGFVDRPHFEKGDSQAVCIPIDERFLD